MQRLRVKLSGSCAEFCSSLFLFGDAWISPGHYLPMFHLFLQFHCTDNEDSCMTVIPVHINVTIQNSF